MNKNSKKKAILNGLDDDLSRVQATKNDFPTDIFPLDIQLVINEVDETLRFLPEYVGASILYASSVAVGNKIKVRVKNNWISASSLFIIIVGRPGDMKSHAISLAIKPLEKIDNISYIRFREELRKYDEALKNGSEYSQRPIFQQLLLNDCTTEALIKALKQSERGIGIYYDEIRGFINSFNKYRGSGNDEELYLSAWSGKTITKNRVSEDAIRLNDMNIDIIGSIQESMICSTFRGDHLNNGFLDRFLFVFPDNYRDVIWSHKDIKKEYIDCYSSLIGKIVNYSFQIEDHKLIKFKKDAFDLLVEWQNNLQRNYVFDYERSIDVKLHDYTIRFSLLIQIITDIHQGKEVENIEIESVQKSIKLYRYFKNNALRVRELYQQDYVDRLSEIQKKAFEILPQKFITGQAVETLVKNGLMKERTVHNFLRDRKLFNKVMHGKYEKR